jgi:anti-repressor protein
MVKMTKDGFSFLVMGYTGLKAGEFKENFINAFNQYEGLLKSDEYIVERALQIMANKTKQLEEKIGELCSINASQEKKIEVLSVKATMFDSAIGDGGWWMASEVCKLGNFPVGFGSKTLLKFLRRDNYLFSTRNEPMQRYKDEGYFDFKGKTIEGISKKGLPYTKKITYTVFSKKGMELCQRLYGKKPEQIALPI